MRRQQRPVGDIRPDPDNARAIAPAARAGLGVALEEFGDLSGLTWNQRNGLLVSGHQRWAELQAAGATAWSQTSATAGVIAHPKTGEPFPIRIVDWDDHKHRAGNLTANNPAIQGEYTEAALEQVRALDKEPGFAELRLDALAELLAADAAPTVAGEGNSDPDAAAEPPPVPTTKPGDLWILGGHRLLCGDSTKTDDVARLMAGETAVLMNTDAPYGVDYTATKAGMPGDAQALWGEGAIANDELTSGPELQAFLERAIRASLPHLSRTCAFYFWHPMLTQGTFFAAAAAAAADILIHRQVIWVKPSMVLTRSGMYHWRHELAFYGWVRGHVPPWYGEKNQTSVWEIGRDDGKSVHPTQKPVALFEIPMANHTRESEICYEPFSGSGSQIIAGERLKRRVFAMELSPRWVDAAVARWETFTGKKAVLEDPDLRSTQAHHGSR